MAETLFYDLFSISKIGFEISIFWDIHSYRMVSTLPGIASAGRAEKDDQTLEG